MVYSVGKIEKSVSPSAKIIAVVESQLRDETLSRTIVRKSASKANPSDEKSLDKSFSLPDTDADGNAIDYSKIVDQGVPMAVGDLLKAETRDKIADSMWQSFNSFKHAWEDE